MDIDFKKAGIKDIPTLISLEQKVSGSKFYSPELTKDEWLEDLNKSEVYLIKADDRVVGNISYEMKSPSLAYISGLVIIPSSQGKGMGRKAMELILEKLQTVKKIELVTHPDNLKARKLYESLGFKIESRIENYFGDGEPRIKMVLNK